MTSQAHRPSRSSFPAAVAIIGMLLLFWFLTSAIYVDGEQAEPVSRFTQVDQSLAEHQGEARSLLDSTRVTDAGSGKVRLSIDRAKALVLAESAK